MNNRTAHHRIYRAHRCKLDELCRVCGCKLHKVSTKPAAKKRLYQCAAFSEELLSAFHIATIKDCHQIHPSMFCNKCYLTMKHVTTATLHKKPYKCGLKPYDWYNHTIHSCKVCTGECNCTKEKPWLRPPAMCHQYKEVTYILYKYSGVYMY